MGLLQQWSSEGFLTPEAAGKLSTYVDLLIEWNPRINLTGLTSRPEIVEILVGESVLAARAVPLAGKSVLDLGSGAGIPGIIWAIIEPSIDLTSLEIREKKVAFQKEAVRILGLKIEVVRGLFPTAVAGRTFDLMVARAVRLTPPLMKQAAAMIKPGGAILRFATVSENPDGWERIPVSKRTSLLRKTFSRL